MLHQNLSPWQSSDWQNALSELITCPHKLADLLEIPPIEMPQTSFPLRLPASLLDRIQKKNPEDPVLKQFLPSLTEMSHHPEFVKDALNEAQYNPTPGLLHKFKGRVLLTVTQSCSVHCRYCFRRHFDYANNTPAKSNFEATLNYLRADPSIHEVIFSGGDPLNLSDKHLDWFLKQLSNITHVHTIRFHTRTAVIIPQRITSDFLTILDAKRFKFVFVVHCNHAQEIHEPVKLTLQLLRKKGIVLNQSVLLKGVNDSFETQFNLCHQLLKCDVVPYYLNLLDQVEGAMHFQVDRETARQIHTQLQTHLPGYGVPKLVKEIPGQAYKINLTSYTHWR